MYVYTLLKATDVMSSDVVAVHSHCTCKPHAVLHNCFCRDVYQSSTTSTTHEGRKVTYVELLRRSNEPLGLGVEGGADRNQTAHISHLRPGGVAEK